MRGFIAFYKFGQVAASQAFAFQIHKQGGRIVAVNDIVFPVAKQNADGRKFKQAADTGFVFFQAVLQAAFFRQVADEHAAAFDFGIVAEVFLRGKAFFGLSGGVNNIQAAVP